SAPGWCRSRRVVYHARTRQSVTPAAPVRHVSCAPLCAGSGLGSGGLGDLAGFEAPRAHIHAPGSAVEHDPHLLQVGIEATLARDHRVAAAVAECGALAAAVTHLCHARAV